MAGLFSLGGGGGRGNNQDDDHHHPGHHNPQTEIPPPDSLFWYKNNEDVSSYRGFELWQQHDQLIPQARPLLHPQQQDLYSSAAALGVGPSRSPINVSDDQSSSRSAAFMLMRPTVVGSGAGGISCQDCGNQAKKDCPHMRCRTCCKSRGFDCQTHIKSTWVPASKRRERQHQLTLLQQQQQQEQQLQLGGSENPKRLRDDNNPSSSALACTRLSSEGSEQGNFPALVSSPAEFRCVRVSSMDVPDDQYAYQTAVNIGGHVFRGILYDQGPDGNYLGGEGSSGVVGEVQPLNFIAGAATCESALHTTAASGGGGSMVSSSGALVDPSSLYPAPLNTFMAGSGTQFFPPSRS